MRGKVWKLPKKQFAALVRRSKTYIEITNSLGYRNNGGGWRMLMQRLKTENINHSHLGFDNKNRYLGSFKAIDQSKLFRENSPYSTNTAKRYIRRDKLITYECALCGLGPLWNNKPLTLTLDHINGVNTDHRLINLRFLCPNCDTQTDTYGGRNIKRPVGEA